MDAHVNHLNAGRGRGKVLSQSRGVALITTLILLGLLGAASLAITLLVSSDTMINGYYRNYRGSFYAAESGANIVVETAKNAILAAANPLSNPPLPAGGSTPSSVTSSYSQYTTSYYSVGDSGSWNGKFELVSMTLPATASKLANQASYCLQASGATGNDAITCDYLYPFTVVVRGQSSGNEDEQIQETGIIHYHSFSGVGASGVQSSFAKWGAFITQFSDCQGPLAQGTMTGPFFTDGQWNFQSSSNPGYTFTGSVGQSGQNVSWWTNNSGCVDSPTAPKGFKAPTFKGGLTIGAPKVVPPTNTYNQAQAILDAKGIPPCTSAPCPAAPAPSAAQMNNELKTAGGTSYPASGTVPNGVYIPYYTNSSGKVYGSDPVNGVGGDGAAGGFYIQGDASVSLSATTNGSGKPTQTYTITQTSGSTTTTTTIVVDSSANGGAGSTTVTQSGLASPVVLSGMPSQLDPNTGQVVSNNDPSGNPVNPTLLYVNGNVTGLSGTVQNNTGITVAASSNINITGDLTYKSSPVTIPADALNSTTDAGVLGIYTTGNINLTPSSNSGNLTVNASLAALSGKTDGTGKSGFCTTAASAISACDPNAGNDNIGTWTIVGGRSEDQAHGVNISQGNTYFDQRFASGSFGPPWFPTAVLQPGSVSQPSSEQTLVSRTSWHELNR